MLYTTFSEESNSQIVIFKHLHWRSSSLCNNLILEKKSSMTTMFVSAKRTIKFNLEIQTFQSVNKQVASIAQPYLEPDEFSQFRILLKSICETYNNKEMIKTVTYDVQLLSLLGKVSVKSMTHQHL